MHPPTPSHPPAAADDQPTTRTAVEAQCGAYRLSEVVGHSARAVVYLATRTDPQAAPRSAANPPCALKRVAPDNNGSVPIESVQTLLREIDLMRQMDHVGIVRSLDHGLGQPGKGASDAFLALELLDGLPLDRVTRRLGRIGEVMPSALSAFVVHEIATALAYAHQLRDKCDRPLGVVHGQLRPKEVMLVRGGQIKLLAFGPHAGNPTSPSNTRSLRRHACYRAPEQIMGRPVDHRADLFALGALFWELLVGPPLFSGTTEHEAVAAVLNNEVPPPSSLRQGIPARLDAIVLRALARDPRRRYPDANALAEDLARGLPTRTKLTSYAATLVANQLGCARSKESPMSSKSAASDAPTPRPQSSGRPPSAPTSTSGSAEARRPNAPPPLPLPARKPTLSRHHHATLPTAVLPRAVPPPLPQDALAPRHRATLPLPAPPHGSPPRLPRPSATPPASVRHVAHEALPLASKLASPLPAPLPAPAPSSTIVPSPTLLGLAPPPRLIKPTPSGITSFVLATPTPTMRPTSPPAFPTRPAHRPPLRSRGERIERLCLQWFSIAALGFGCGVLWQQHRVSDGPVSRNVSEDHRHPDIVALANDMPPPEPEPGPLQSPMIIEAAIPHATTTTRHRSIPPRGSLRAIAVRRVHAIR
jgi:serine/threonine protein kinase